MKTNALSLQGKPIMVRIKAKPLPRLPMAPGAGGQMKNGYRQTPPPPQPTATAQIFDPTAAAAAAAAYQQRIFLTNPAIQPAGAVPTTTFGQQVQFFVSLLSLFEKYFL